MPQVEGVAVDGDATADSVNVTWTAVDGAKSYVVRWGQHDDGVQDGNIALVKGATTFEITESIPAVGESIDIYVTAFNSDTFADADEALRSDEYLNVWSELVTAEIKAATPSPAPPVEENADGDESEAKSTK